MLAGLGGALIAEGHEAQLFNVEKEHPSIRGYDAAIAINRPRDTFVPKEVRHVAWIQDYMPGIEPDYPGQAQSEDLIFTLGHGPIIGVPCLDWPQYRGSLLVGVDPSLLTYPEEPYEFDISLAGSIGEPFIYWRANKSHTIEMQQEIQDFLVRTLRELIKPLTGSLDQAKVAAELREIITKKFPNLWDELDPQFTAAFIHEFARIYDRWTIADLMLEASDNIALVGMNWHLYPQYKDHAGAFLTDRQDLHRLYRASKINVHNNIFGFALHTRVLECMAVGGFVMAHSAPNLDWNFEGQIDSEFSPGLHYGWYNGNNFIEQAQFWLEQPELRRRAQIECRKIIIDCHLWQHRAQQLLAALR